MSSHTEQVETPQALEEDIWTFPAPIEITAKTGKLRSWEGFQDRNFLEPRTSYISERGSQVFDSVLELRIEHSGQVIHSGILLRSLLQLGLGRQSILYYYDERGHSFNPRIEDGRMAGVSLMAFRSLSAALLEQGNSIRHVRDFVTKTQSMRDSFPALVALGGQLLTTLSSLEALVLAEEYSVSSVLQLQQLFERPRKVLPWFNCLIASIDGAKTDENLLSRVFEAIQKADHELPWLREILFDILAAVSRCWQKSVGAWTGLETDVFLEGKNRLPAFVKLLGESNNGDIRKGATEYDYDFIPSKMPSFICEADASLIFETGRSVRLLREHVPEHPLARPTGLPSIECHPFKWQSTWHDIERISNRAKEYEDNLRDAIKTFGVQGRTDTTTGNMIGETHSKNVLSAMSEQQARDYLHNSIVMIEESLDEELSIRIGGFGPVSAEGAPATEVFTPPVTLLPSLSFRPFLTAQARLVNQACLRLLFQDHDIRAHFSLLYRYSLLGDGVFASRLSHALFDPELSSAERRKGHSRSGISGLKLGYRDTWPPASSELRLALMGILTDSYMPQGSTEKSSLFRNELPGGLSFAIRELSEEGMQKCIDSDSVNALDFLRLQYRAPSPLNAVITATSLVKYDAIFKLLLRAKRMLFVVNQLSRDLATSISSSFLRNTECQRFRIESHHFVITMCSYLFDQVTKLWNIFKYRMEEIATTIDHDAMDNGESAFKVRDFHEHLLDRMMFALLLRKRQAEVMKLLEEIFGSVLRFANCVRNAARGFVGCDLRESYRFFQKQVKIFVNVCRGLSERRGQRGTEAATFSSNIFMDGHVDEDGDNAIGQLLLKFEMSGFYAR